jgi:peptidoglycan hydrolase CwlO-like protein
MLINILLLLFSMLIIYQLFLATSSIYEGFDSTYQPYDTNNPNNVLILTQQNSGNIAYLKEKIDTLDGLKEKVNDLSTQVDSLNQQIQAINQQNASNASKLVGDKPLQVSGTSYN